MRRDCTPPDAHSRGEIVYVPELVTVCCASGASQPNSPLWYADVWRAAEPMMSNGSPYSLYEQELLYATRVPPSRQLSDEAWWTPRLWLSSWPSVWSMK